MNYDNLQQNNVSARRGNSCSGATSRSFIIIIPLSARWRTVLQGNPYTSLGGWESRCDHMTLSHTCACEQLVWWCFSQDCRRCCIKFLFDNTLASVMVSYT